MIGQTNHEVACWQMQCIIISKGDITFPNEGDADGNGTCIFGLHTAQSIVNIGRLTGNTWDGRLLGPDQFRVLDMLYIDRTGLAPIT